jgi:hypothetical protein
LRGVGQVRRTGTAAENGEEGGEYDGEEGGEYDGEYGGARGGDDEVEDPGCGASPPLR